MLNLENLSKEYGARTLFKNLQLSMPRNERIALIGANGAGKTTLLRILTGEEEATSGQVTRPKDTVLGYLPQEPSQNPKPTILAEVVSGAEKCESMHCRMVDLLAEFEDKHDEHALHEYSELEAQYRSLGGYELEAKAKEIMIGLGFQEEQFPQSPLVLSGGWRMRIELAKIFLNKPNILLLDEPTNHLDLPSLVWVEDYLMRFEGTLLFVSHDRPLLNRLATYIWELRQGQLYTFRGNLDRYFDYREEIAAQNLAQKEQLRRKQEQLQDFADRFGAKASKATQAQSKLKQIARLRSMEEQIPEDEAMQQIQLTLPKPPHCARMVLQVKDLAIGYPNKSLAKNISFAIERGMKLAVIGANGIGKSTFLKTLVGKNPKISGEIIFGDRVDMGYFAQDQMQELNPEDTVLDSVTNSNFEIGDRGARSLLGNLLFRGDDVKKKIKVLSGGEKNRVGLARVLASRNNFLLLDEPTNHLDMSSVGVLGMALADYSGTLAFVSHDREFIDNVCTHILVMLADGRCALFEGKLEDYRRMAALSGFPYILASGDTEGEKQEKTVQQPKIKTTLAPPKTVDKSKSHQLKNIERKLEQSKAKLATIDQELAAVTPTDYGKLHELTNNREKISEEIEALENAWLELETA